jgi:hypothetical protein
VANGDPDLSPADAAWATNRYRADSEIANLLKMTRESASQVLLRLDRDGFIHLNGGPAKDEEPTSGPRGWAGRVLSLLFPAIEVEFRNMIDGNAASGDTDAAKALPQASLALPEREPSSDPDVRERRVVTELEAEIKKMERQRHGRTRLDIGGATCNGWQP